MVFFFFYLQYRTSKRSKKYFQHERHLFYLHHMYHLAFLDMASSRRSVTVIIYEDTSFYLIRSHFQVFRVLSKICSKETSQQVPEKLIKLQIYFPTYNNKFWQSEFINLPFHALCCMSEYISVGPKGCRDRGPDQRLEKIPAVLRPDHCSPFSTTRTIKQKCNVSRSGNKNWRMRVGICTC